jgi:hypothetical protein
MGFLCSATAVTGETVYYSVSKVQNQGNGTRRFKFVKWFDLLMVSLFCCDEVGALHLRISVVLFVTGWPGFASSNVVYYSLH